MKSVKSCLMVFLTVVSAVGLVARAAHAGIRPEFGSCIGDATHIVLVHIMDDASDTFLVVESWYGDLKPKEVVAVPGLGKMAGDRMVLCLKRAAGDPSGRAEWVGAGRDLRTSVAWIFGQTIYAVQQPMNPGPAYITQLDWTPTPEKLKQHVLWYVADRRQFETAMSTRDVDQRVAALAKLATGVSRYDRRAIEELGKCGPKAVGVLRGIIKGPHDYRQCPAITAFAAAGGAGELSELDTMLDAEFDYWKRTAPTLKRHWWVPGDTWNKEANIRYANLMALVKTLNHRGHPAARKKTEAIRDLFRAQPVLQGDQGITRMSDYCEFILEGKLK